MTSLNNFKMDADRNVDEPVSISLQIPDLEIKILIDYLNIRWLVELLILMTCWATCKKTWTSRGLRPNRREFVLLVPSLLLGKWSLHLATLGIQSTSCAVTATRNWEQWTFLRGMASHTVSKTTITSSPPGVATARVPFWTSASLHLTRLGILSISSALIVADRWGEHLLWGRITCFCVSVWWWRFSWERWCSFLQRLLLWAVCTQMWRLQHTHHWKLHFISKFTSM